MIEIALKSDVLPFGSEPFRVRHTVLAPRSAFNGQLETTMSVSAEEVAKHNSDKDCWVIVGDQVLDVTNFLSH